jgi:hypothetical protein
MVLPWLIGQAFAKVSPAAMMGLIFVDTLLNLSVLLLFVRVSTKSGSVAHSPATAD